MNNNPIVPPFKLCYIGLVFIIATFACRGQISYLETSSTENIPRDNDSISQIAYLDNLADSITKYATDKNREEFEILFFNIFPNSFSEFKSLYGYTDDSIFIKAPGYELSHKHVFDVFSQLKFIDDSTFANKIIKICIEAEWQADAVNDLQHILRVKIQSNENLEVYFSQLSKLKERDIEQFWNFYFFKSDDILMLSSFQSMKDEFPKVYRILEEEYKQSKSK